jgi:hypothetical protein
MGLENLMEHFRAADLATVARFMWHAGNDQTILQTILDKVDEVSVPL